MGSEASLAQTVKAVAATGNLSTGFREESLVHAVKDGADFIGCDGGSTDAGPYYLGSGKPRGPRDGVKRNLRLMLREALKADIPVIIGTAGHAGGRPHLEWTVGIVRELARENNWHFTLAAINSEVEKEVLAEALARREIAPLSPAPPFERDDILNAERFVAMMGIEPIQRALDAGAQVVIGGRCSDVAIYAALPVARGISRGVAFHAGKILECGAASAVQRPILTAWQRNWTRMASPSHLLTLIFTVRHRACRPILCMKRETLIISSSLEEPSIPATRNLRPQAIARCVSPAADSSRQPSTPCALKALPSSAIVRLWSLGSGIPWFYANWIAFFRLCAKWWSEKFRRI